MYEPEYKTYVNYDNSWGWDVGQEIEYISKITFKNKKFNINFTPREYDYNDVQDFCEKILNGADTELYLDAATCIEFTANATTIEIFIDLAPDNNRNLYGSLTFTSSRTDWLDAIKKLKQDLILFGFYSND